MKRRQEQALTPQEEQQQDVIEALKRRKFHLPGNKTWWEDWRQYITNNHPLLALIGCGHNYNNNNNNISNNHHQEEETVHDIRKRRFLVFLSSLCCGISLSIGAYLWSKNTNNDDSLSEIMLRFTISTYPNSTTDNNESDDYLIVNFARYQIYLWTWMSILHVVHDLMIWYCCCCFLSSSSLSLLRGYILWTILWIVAVTSLLVSVAVSEASTTTIDQVEEIMDDEAGEEEEDYDNNNNNIIAKLLTNIVIELVFAWIVWFPIVATTLFSGVLGCFKVPILGGRRQELYTLRQKQREYPVKTMNALAEYDACTTTQGA